MGAVGSAKWKTYQAIKKIVRYDEDFDRYEFAETVALNIYKNVHEALVNRDEEKLKTLVTEYAYPEITHNTEFKTIRWQFLKQLETPLLVQARCNQLMEKENVFAQLTIRLHSQQILAVYDRHGRLEYGSEVSIEK